MKRQRKGVLGLQNPGQGTSCRCRSLDTLRPQNEELGDTHSVGWGACSAVTAGSGGRHWIR